MSTDNSSKRNVIPLYFTLKEVGDIFGRSPQYARSLIKKGMPCFVIGSRIIRIPKQGFWEWLGISEPEDPFSVFITIGDLAKEFDVPACAVYNLRKKMPDSILIHVGHLVYIKRESFWKWLSEQAIKNAGERRNGMQNKKRRSL